MTEQELLQMRDLAEDGKLQFKERANDRYDISCEGDYLRQYPN